MRPSDGGLVVSATWGARCGKSARRVLRGGTSARRYAGSVRALARKGQLQRGSAKATAPRLVPTSQKLVRRGYAVASDCIHNRARLYHIHHKPLYHTIGEAESRYRRPVPARCAGERLMRLDAALTSPHLDWLTTRSEKVALLRARTALEAASNPMDATTQEGSELATSSRGRSPSVSIRRVM